MRMNKKRLCQENMKTAIIHCAKYLAYVCMYICVYIYQYTYIYTYTLKIIGVQTRRINRDNTWMQYVVASFF